MSDYIPLDESNIEEMLKIIGVNKVDDLFHDIPPNLRLQQLNLPKGLSEPDLFRQIKSLSEKNKHFSTSFLGAGNYFHYSPTLVDFILSRSEFYTAYTPYQAEASQGFLQAIYEYQTAITRLTAMDVANASMYDGSTALAEAAILAATSMDKKKVILVEGIHPEYIEVVKTYCWGRDIAVEIVKSEDLPSKLNEEYAAVIFQSPNFFGDIENIADLCSLIRSKIKKCLIVQTMTDPTCLGVLEPPGSFDIDIFVAEGQALGLPPSFGGPGLGIFVVKSHLMRKMPGRLIGKTRELHGDGEGFVLTLQAREQHIRREKALSNICSNQSLCMLGSLIYMVALGKTGLQEIAKQNFQKANFVKKSLAKLLGYKVLNIKPTYNEFLVECPNIGRLTSLCKQKGIMPPLAIEKYYPAMKNVALICVTEMNSKENINQFISVAKEAAQ